MAPRLTLETRKVLTSDNLAVQIVVRRQQTQTESIELLRQASRAVYTARTSWILHSSFLHAPMHASGPDETIDIRHDVVGLRGENVTLLTQNQRL